MKILLDTNVLFSGLGFKGTVGQLLEVLVLQDHTIVTSEYILEELREKIRIKFRGKQKAQALDLLLHILGQIRLEVRAESTYQSNIADAQNLFQSKMHQSWPVPCSPSLNSLSQVIAWTFRIMKNLTQQSGSRKS